MNAHLQAWLLVALIGVGVGVATVGGCEDAGGDERADGAWPHGTTEERIDALADHIGGFSPAMREVGYRYNELYFAGEEENWRLADYHAGKIGSAIEDGIERRPDRGESAQPFLDEALPALREAIRERDAETFQWRFRELRNSCNRCHEAEDVAFIEVREPERRLYPWGTPDD